MDDLDFSGKPAKADQVKLENLIKRQQIYGDITQNATKEDLEKLLRYFNNEVPQVIAALEEKVRRKGSRTFIPPAFYGRDGVFTQPPSFEMPIYIEKPSEFSNFEEIHSRSLENQEGRG